MKLGKQAAAALRSPDVTLQHVCTTQPPSENKLLAQRSRGSSRAMCPLPRTARAEGAAVRASPNLPDGEQTRRPSPGTAPHLDCQRRAAKPPVPRAKPLLVRRGEPEDGKGLGWCVGGWFDCYCAHHLLLNSASFDASSSAATVPKARSLLLASLLYSGTSPHASCPAPTHTKSFQVSGGGY